MTTDIDVSIAPLVPQQAGDQLIAVRNGAIVRALVSSQSILALVARTGNYGDLLGLPDLSPSALGAATAAQGLLAETAVQPMSLATVAMSGNYGDLQGAPDLSLAGLGAATADQGLLAETAVQPAAIAAFETTTQLDARDTVNRDRANHTGTQPTSTIEGFVATAAGAAPVQSVAGRAGAVVLAKADVGLPSVDNTSDLDKPVSTATQTALDDKANTSHTQPWSSILGAPTTLTGYGITDAASATQGSKADSALQPAALAPYETTTQLNARDTANRARGNHTGTQPTSTIEGFAATAAAAAPVQSVAGRAGAVVLAKADVGLSQADNTSDLAKPISTATQAALNGKANTADLAAVATSGQYSALLGIPSTFTPAAHNQAWNTITSTPTTLAGYGITNAATAAQGAKADTALQPAALASYETTTQLNARDTANRAWANLTGKPTIPFGFVYDQQAEPVGPTAGQVWRERSAGGLVVADWEWVDTFSEWINTITYELHTTSLAGAGAINATGLTFTNRKRYVTQCTVQVINVSGTFDASNSIVVGPLLSPTLAGTILYNLASSNSCGVLYNATGLIQKTTPLNFLLNFGSIRISRGPVVGSPGSTNSQISFTVRDCRL